MINRKLDSARALRPLRRPALPGGRTLLRAGLVAALLGLAAAILHTPTDMDTATGCPAANGAVRAPVRLARPAVLPVARPRAAVEVGVRLTRPAVRTIARPRLAVRAWVRLARPLARSAGAASGSVPVWGALGEEPVVVAAAPLAPAVVGVVRGLLGQHHEVVAQVDGAVVIAARALRAGVLGAHERQD